MLALLILIGLVIWALTSRLPRSHAPPPNAAPSTEDEGWAVQVGRAWWRVPEAQSEADVVRTLLQHGIDPRAIGPCHPVRTDSETSGMDGLASTSVVVPWTPPGGSGRVRGRNPRVLAP